MDSLETIQAKDLKKDYGGAIAVNGISFYIFKGECYGLLGPNGAGKTTTVKMISCVSPRDSGELSVNEMDVGLFPRKIKKILGVVPQDENLDPDLTVIKNLIVFARYFSIAEKDAISRAEELLDFFSLSERKNSMISELSGGMRRRVLIARALINNPKILILDEPTTGLDPQARHHIWQRLRLLKKNGITLILTTHYMEEASQLCDRIAIMDKGNILIEGNPKNLILERVGKEVIEIQIEQKYEHMFLETIKEFHFTHERVGDTLLLFSLDGRDVLHTIITNNNISFIHRPAGLEDLFLKLTGRGLKE